MKFLFKMFMVLHVGLYRLTGGKFGGNIQGFKVLILTTTGRKSGKVRTVPLGFFEQPQGYVIVASNNGLPTHPAWYQNLKANPRVTIQVFDKVMFVTAEVLDSESRARAWQQVISAAPSYAAYEKKKGRQIPLVLLHPDK